MHTVKEKVSNAAAAAKEHVDITKARVEEAAAKASATTKEEKKIAEEVRKAKEAEAEMKLHQTHAENAAEKLRGRHSHHVFGHNNPVYGAQGHHEPVGTAVPNTGVPAPTYHTPQGHHEPVGTAVPTTGVPAPTYPLGGHVPGGHQKYH